MGLLGRLLVPQLARAILAQVTSLPTVRALDWPVAMCHGLELRCCRQPYMDVLPLPKIEVVHQSKIPKEFQEHTIMNETYHISLFSYNGYLNGQLDVYLIFLHTVHTCEYAPTIRFAHLLGSFLVGRAFFGNC